ncbi:MAG: right-handed parallel beta-helix repeat-containing protein [Calditrichota bacterium]
MRDRFLLTVLTWGLTLSSAFAQTQVRGNVAGVWNPEGSPYIAVDNLVIPAGQNLTIRPGVQVRFNPTFSLSVNGLLTAVGMEDDSIVFTPNREGERWRGIRIVGADNRTQLSYCVVEFAETIGQFDEERARGGGIFIDHCDALISHNTIHHNLAAGRTAGVFAQNSNPTVSFNHIHHNRANTNGAVEFDECDGIISHNLVEFNESQHGGGILVYHRQPIVESNVILHNASTVMVWGTGLYFAWNCRSQVRNNLIANNNGGGLYVGAGSDIQDFTNNTIVNNPGRCGVLVYEANLALTNCIIRNHADPIWLVNGSSARASYSDIQAFANEGLRLGEGMMDVDPLFMDENNFDYRLHFNSPCRDAGDPESPRDPDGSRADIGCYLGAPFSLLFEPDTIDFGRLGRGMDAVQNLSVTWVLEDDQGENLFILIAAPEDQQNWLGVIPGEEDLTPNEPALFQVVANIPDNAEPGLLEGRIDVFLEDDREPTYTLPVHAEIMGVGLENRSLILHRGWNMISTNVDPIQPDIRRLMQPLVRARQLEMLKDDQGRFYYPANNFCNIPRWEFAQGYLIKLTDHTELTFNGLPLPADQPIALREGWQMAAYYPRIAGDAQTALSGIEELLEIAKDGAGSFYIPRLNFCNMPNLTEGQGYLLKLRENVDLIWQVGDGLQGQRIFPQSKHFNKPDPTNWNLSVLLETPSLKVGDEVAAFSPERRLVGVGLVDEGLRVGLTVWGDDPTTISIDGINQGDSIHFKVWDGAQESDGSVQVLEGSLKYRTDEFVHGIITLLAGTAPTEFHLERIYPNPFNHQLQIEFSLNAPALIEVKLSDITGRVIREWAGGFYQVGRNRLTLDASGLPDGVYGVVLDAGGKRAIAKVCLIK